MHDSSSEHFLSSAFIKKAWRYNVSLVVWILALLVFWAIGLKSLERAYGLPAPPIMATYCIDERFKFLHENDFADATVLAVGSSVTMHRELSR